MPREFQLAIAAAHFGRLLFFLSLSILSIPDHSFPIHLSLLSAVVNPQGVARPKHTRPSTSNLTHC